MRAFAKHLRPVERFLRWWLMELWTLVPARVRRLAGKRKSAFVIAFEGERAALLREAGGQLTVLSDIDLARPALETADRLQRLMPARRRSGGARVRVRLAMQQALRTTVTLPQAAEENLSEVLGFELDRRTPFRAEDVHFAHRIEQRDAESRSLKVALTVVPRRAVDAVLGTVRQFGFEADAVEIARASGDGIDMLPLHTRREKSRRFGTAVRVAIAGVFLASAVAAYASTHAESDDRDALSRKVNGARALAAKTQEVCDAIARLEDEKSTTAAGHVHGNQWLTEITRLLPDDTWLDRLSLSARKVTLAGHSASSSNLIQILEGSQLLASPSFASPVTQSAESGKDEFTITATMRGAE